MDVFLVAGIAGAPRVVLLGCEAHKAILVHVHAQGVDRRDCYVDPQVELVPIDE